MGRTSVATESAETIEARCGALAACHASLAAHNDAHDPSAPPCVAIAVACSVLALDTLVSNSERHLKLCDASSAGRNSKGMATGRTHSALTMPLKVL